MHPRSGTDIDDEWLSRLLGEPVTIAEATTVGVGIGLLAAVVRVHLHDGRELYVKLPSPDERARSIAQHFGYGAREAGTYAHLLPEAGIATPRCRAIVDAPLGPILVLDALVEHRPADQLAGATDAEAFAAVDLLAALHARFWNAPALAACAWLPGPDDPVITMYDQLFTMSWERFCSMAEDLVPPDHLRVAEVVVERFGEVCRAFSRAPRTLVHGDYRLDNLLFDTAGRAAVLDWQLAAWGRGAYDLAFFASGSIDPDRLAVIEDALLERYHAGLVAQGVEGYHPGDARRDYLGGLIMNLPNPVTALVAVPPGNERGERLLRENARRALATVARHAASLSSW